MEHVRAFKGFPALPELQNYLLKSNTPFEASELYSSARDAKIVDESLRNSCFRSFEGEEIFGMVNQTVQWLNKSDKSYSYQLRRDNITETRYEQGGHFLKHKDFLSVTSNLVEEFTLILCVTPEALAATVDGGNTVIYPYASRDGTSFDTTTPGNGLLFRKDLDHAGGLLKAGEKHILTANLWATRKQASDQVLFVTFPSEESPLQADRLRESINQDTSYALPVDVLLEGSMLDAHVRFVNRRHELAGENLPVVVPYECANFTFEEFGTVVKILQRSYVGEECLRHHSACIDFFGPFANANILVNLAVEPKAPAAASADGSEASCKRFVKPSNVKGGSPAMDRLFKKFKTTGEHKAKPGTEDLDVIVCESESRTKVVYETALLLGQKSYVPFKLIFVEGIVSQGYFDSYEHVNVTPVALVVGDYNHIFGLQRCVLGVQSHSLKAFHTKHNYFEQHGAEGQNGLFSFHEEHDEDSEDDDYWQAHYDFCSESRGLGLKLAFGDGRGTRKKLTGYLFGGSLHDTPFLEFKPLSRFTTEGDETVTGQLGDETKLFHRDDKGKATFTEAEAAAASQFIASLGLEERVKACLQQKRFDLPQESKEYDEYYCNESTYANINILYVTGVMKLDPSLGEGKPTSTTRGFDAWPLRGQKKKRMEEANESFESKGIRAPWQYYEDGNGYYTESEDSEEGNY